MKRLMWFITLLAMVNTGSAEISTDYALLGWTDGLPTSRRREFERGINTLLGLNMDVYTVSAAWYSNTVTHVVMQIGCFHKTQFRPGITDTDVDNIVKNIPKPDQDQLVKTLTSTPVIWLTDNHWIAVKKD